MSFSGDEEDDFYTSAVKKLAKYNDIDSDEDEWGSENDTILLSKSTSPLVKQNQKQELTKKVKSTNGEKENVVLTPTVKKLLKCAVPVQEKRVTRQSRKSIDKVCIEPNSPIKKKSPVKKKRTRKQRQTRATKVLDSSIIVLSDDEELHTNATNEQTVSDVNFEYKIKIWWQCRELKDFKIRRYQKLTSIFDYYSQREQLSINRLLFLINNKTIYPNDTPDSLNLAPVQIIEGGFLNEDSSIDLLNHKNNEHLLSSSMIQLKVQLRDRKKPLIVAIKKTEPLSILMAKCSEELECEINKLKFQFDGDLLNPNDTPESLDFDGGECIDVFVK